MQRPAPKCRRPKERRSVIGVPCCCRQSKGGALSTVQQQATAFLERTPANDMVFEPANSRQQRFWTGQQQAATSLDRPTAGSNVFEPARPQSTNPLSAHDTCGSEVCHPCGFYTMQRCTSGARKTPTFNSSPVSLKSIWYKFDSKAWGLRYERSGLHHRAYPYPGQQPRSAQRSQSHSSLSWPPACGRNHGRSY